MAGEFTASTGKVNLFYWHRKVKMMLSGVCEVTEIHFCAPRTQREKQMDKLLTDNQTDGRSDELTTRLITGGKDRGRQKARAKRDWHPYAWTNRWRDSLNRQTDRQMVLLLEKASFDEMDKQNRLRWDSLNGQAKK